MLGAKDAERFGRVVGIPQFILWLSNTKHFILLIGNWVDENFKEIDGDVKKNLEPGQSQFLEDIQSRIDDAIRPYVENGNYAFVKLSTRRYMSIYLF